MDAFKSSCWKTDGGQTGLTTLVQQNKGWCCIKCTPKTNSNGRGAAGGGAGPGRHPPPVPASRHRAGGGVGLDWPRHGPDRQTHT